MFAMVTDRPPTKLAPGVGVILWGKLARPNGKEAASYLRKVARECEFVPAALERRLGQMYRALKAEVFDYDEIAKLLADLGSSITEQYIYAEPFGGKETNPFRTIDCEYFGRTVRLLSHEWTEVSVEDLHINVFGTANGDASHFFVQTGDFEFTAGEDGIRGIMDQAQVDGCTKQQALVVALGATADKMPKDLNLGGYFQIHLPYGVMYTHPDQLVHRTDEFCASANDFLSIKYEVQNPVTIIRNRSTGTEERLGGDIVHISGADFGLWPVPNVGKAIGIDDFPLEELYRSEVYEDA